MPTVVAANSHVEVACGSAVLVLVPDGKGVRVAKELVREAVKSILWKPCSKSSSYLTVVSILELVAILELGLSGNIHHEVLAYRVKESSQVHPGLTLLLL